MNVLWNFVIEGRVDGLRESIISFLADDSKEVEVGVFHAVWESSRDFVRLAVVEVNHGNELSLSFEFHAVLTNFLVVLVADGGTARHAYFLGLEVDLGVVELKPGEAKGELIRTEIEDVAS